MSNNNDNRWDLSPSTSEVSDDWAIPAQPQPQPQAAFQPQPQPQAAFQPLPPKPSAPAKKSTGGRKILALLLGLVLFIAGGVAVFAFTKSNKNVAAMSYISSSDPGPQIFMGSVADPNVQTLIDDKGLKATPMGGGKDGSDPNLYGGSGELSVCDAVTLVKNLNQDLTLKAAFASGVGVRAEDVATYVESLKSVILMQDTWVTNHGYEGGKATPYQSVLQKGTAVLVDAKGVPRVRCACGNPLAEAWDGYTAPTESTAFWDGYDSKKVVAVVESEKSAAELSVTDVHTGQKSKVEISEQERKAQQDAQEAVTDDTPVTSPKDMGVQPDKKLLDDLGLPVAQGGDKRPEGIARFVDYDKLGAGESGATGWRAETTPVDPEDFEIPVEKDVRYFLVHMEDHSGGCLITLNKSDDSLASVECKTSELSQDIKNYSYAPGPGPKAPPNFLMWDSDTPRFEPIARPMDTLIGGGGLIKKEIPNLQPGESIEVGGAACYNLSDRFGCEVKDSSFEAVDGKGVYFGGSADPYGAICGKTSTGYATIRTAGGPVDCASAKQVVSDYSNLPPEATSQGTHGYGEVGDWACARGFTPEIQETKIVSTCTQNSAPYGKIVMMID